MMQRVVIWLEALRIKHWVKGVFCLVAVFFHGDALNLAAWAAVLPMVVAFGLVSSAGYLLNDLVNLEEDRHHPRKRRRPLARGALNPGAARIAMIVSALSGLGLALAAYGWGLALAVLAGYYVLQWLYTYIFRDLPLVDVLILGLGFVARAAAGTFALRLLHPGIVPTGWLLLCTYFLALLLGFGKRRGEWLLLQKTHHEVGETRRALRGYTALLLDVLLVLCLLLVGGVYVSYCFLRADSDVFIFTVIPVVIGLVSYGRLAWRSPEVETPEVLLWKDRVLLLSLGCWAVMVLYLTT